MNNGIFGSPTTAIERPLREVRPLALAAPPEKLKFPNYSLEKQRRIVLRIARKYHSVAKVRECLKHEFFDDEAADIAHGPHGFEISVWSHDGFEIISTRSAARLNS